MRELPTPVIGAPARRVVPKCKGSREENSSWKLSFRGRKGGRGRRYVSHVQKRRLSRNGGDGSIEDDEAENICQSEGGKRSAPNGIYDSCVRVCVWERLGTLSARSRAIDSSIFFLSFFLSPSPPFGCPAKSEFRGMERTDRCRTTRSTF